MDFVNRTNEQVLAKTLKMLLNDLQKPACSPEQAKLRVTRLAVFVYDHRETILKALEK
jgi:hypothetical protein